MRQSAALLGSAIFFLVAPFLLSAIIPGWITHWQFRPPFLAMEGTRIIGATLVLAGIPVLVESFLRFALQGLGTPAPIAPTERLVVTGFYRFVRNPMYVAVTTIIIGQSLLFGDWRLLAYGALFWMATHIFVVTYEEPTLVHSFGAQYERYRANVPRWLPRVTPWRQEQ